MRYLTALLLLFTVHAPADEPFLSTAAGLKAGNQLTRRGATLYEGLWLSPVLYVGLFQKRVQFFGNSLEYVDFVWGRQARVRSRLGFTSDRPSVKTGEPFTFRNSRENSLEWTNSVETFFPSFEDNRVQADVVVAKDLKAHFGTHVELTGRLTLGRWYFENGRPLIQPQLFATVGFGSARHNRYFYGLGADESSLDYLAAGLYLVAPSRIDPAFPVVELAYSRVLGSRNRAGTLVADKTDGVYLTVTAAVGIFSL